MIAAIQNKELQIYADLITLARNCILIVSYLLRYFLINLQEGLVESSRKGRQSRVSLIKVKDVG